MTQFKDVLKSIHCELDVETADDVIRVLFQAMFHGSLSEDGLLTRPRLALAFGEAVCYRWRVSRTDDNVDVVLNRFLGLRKMGKMKKGSVEPEEI